MRDVALSSTSFVAALLFHVSASASTIFAWTHGWCCTRGFCGPIGFGDLCSVDLRETYRLPGYARCLGMVDIGYSVLERHLSEEEEEEPTGPTLGCSALALH